MLRRVLDRESVVKSNLIKRLVDCVKELQFKHAADKGAALVNDEATNLLCWILEAVFIHGLKNPFLKSMSSVFHTRENNIPEPSFWEFVLIFCHQEVIVQINTFSYISTDVGRCRAWLRLALNDGLLISYLQMMLKDKSTLKDYFKPTAFLRDSEMCDMLKNYLYGIESYDFQLACNSSLLNAWNSGPLSLVGLWTVSTTNENVSQGIDVAENMDSRDLQVIPGLQSGRSSSRPKDLPYVTRPPLLEEEEALRVILASKPSGSGHSSRRSSLSTPPIESFLSSGSTNTLESSSRVNNPASRDASLTRLPNKAIVSSIVPVSEAKKEEPPVEKLYVAETEIESDVIPVAVEVLPSAETVFDVLETSVSPAIKISSSNSISENVSICNKSNTYVEEPEPESYMDLLKTYNQYHPVGTPITDSYMEDVFPQSSTPQRHEENRIRTPSSPIENLGFELLTTLSNSEHFSEMLPHIHAYLQKIPNEVGLDCQNYRCKNCDRPIGMIYGPAKVCALSGNYFCQECHISEESVIPARILLNWDFGRYSVSKQGKLFIQDILDRPLFHLNEINSKIYSEVDECREVETLRAKLQSIALYLRTCKEPVMSEIIKEISPKEHLYEDIHLYSLGDLLNIPNRSLATTLSKLVYRGVSHVLTCDICRQKGFVCEVCKDPKVIFPFDFEHNYKCLSCGAVYHSKCMNSRLPCPRCQRWWKSEGEEAEN
ncbi:unnamed protein product [Allacma fusca]|uniref:Pleckstrin homology domain-containing family M member 3 n=1 Tax=Allacma fusca TaxID=39272 RepID=A0A8J2PL83_9HEXA|nr:unnamed protein product [Allacma fusca]